MAVSSSKQAQVCVLSWSSSLGPDCTRAHASSASAEISLSFSLFCGDTDTRAWVTSIGRLTIFTPLNVNDSIGPGKENW